MVCTICGKHSRFCIGRAQSICCAKMQHVTAVGHRHVRPTPTNTRLVNPPMKRSVGYPVGPVTKKVVFSPAEPTIRGGCLLSFRLALCYYLHLRPNKAPFSNPPILCRTPFWPLNCLWLVTVLLQGNVELHFDLFVHKWMHVRVNLRPYCVKCVINGFKGFLLAGFDDVAELIVKCCLLPFCWTIYCIYLFNWIFFDILKITKIQTIFKNMQSVMECVICHGQNTWNL